MPDLSRRAIVVAALMLAVVPRTSEAQYTFPQDLVPGDTPTDPGCPGCLTVARSVTLTWTIYYYPDGRPMAYTLPPPFTVPAGSTVDSVALTGLVQTAVQINRLELEHGLARALLPLNGAAIAYPFYGARLDGTWNLSVWLWSVEAAAPLRKLVVTVTIYYHYTVPDPDYALAVVPNNASTVRGGTTALTLRVTPANGFSAPVDVAGIENLPAGATFTLSNWTLAAPSWQATLTVNPGSAAAGTYYPVVRSTSGTLDRRASFGWTIVPVTVTITPTTASVYNGKTKQFTATTNAPNPAVTWSVQEGAAGGTVTSSGLYTAASTPGTFHVVATSASDPSRSAAATVTVSCEPLEYKVSGGQCVLRWPVVSNAAPGALFRLVRSDGLPTCTFSKLETLSALALGSTFELILGYASPVSRPGTVALYRYDVGWGWTPHHSTDPAEEIYYVDPWGWDWGNIAAMNPSNPVAFVFTSPGGHLPLHQSMYLYLWSGGGSAFGPAAETLCTTSYAEATGTPPYEYHGVAGYLSPTPVP
jgi:hypothetical protein